MTHTRPLGARARSRLCRQYMASEQDGGMYIQMTVALLLQMMQASVQLPAMDAEKQATSVRHCLVSAARPPVSSSAEGCGMALWENMHD